MKQELTQSNILIENAHSMNQQPQNHPLSEQFTTPDPENDSCAKDEVHNQVNRVQKQLKKIQQIWHKWKSKSIAVPNYCIG